MSKVNKDNKSSKFRLAVIDDRSHKHLFNVHFTKTSFFVAIVSIIVVLTAIEYSIIAFTPVRTFIPGYPDAHSKRAAIQNAMRIDSLENVIFRWELYSENLRRVSALEFLQATSDIQKRVFRTLAELGLDVTIQSNIVEE